jgi:drug/metabolite transporter (DMT)-like permease
VSKTSGLWFALGAAFLFGVSGVVAIDAFAAVTPTQLTQVRSVITTVILGTVAIRGGQAHPRGHLSGLALLGIFLASVSITYYVAIDRLGLGPGVTLQFMGPALVLVWMRFVQHREVTPTAWLAASVALVGTALMTRAWRFSSLDPIGVAAGAGAAVTFAGYLITGEHLGKRLPSITVAAYGFGFASVVWLVAVRPSVLHLSGGVWAQMLWVAVAGTAVPFFLEMAALRRADPGRIGMVATAEPVIGSAGAWIFLGQALVPAQIAGGVMVVLGIAAVQLLTNSVAPDIPDMPV